MEYKTVRVVDKLPDTNIRRGGAKHEIKGKGAQQNRNFSNQFHFRVKSELSVI